jgi:hypothetical protein
MLFEEFTGGQADLPVVPGVGGFAGAGQPGHLVATLGKNWPNLLNEYRNNHRGFT